MRILQILSLLKVIRWHQIASWKFVLVGYVAIISMAFLIKHAILHPHFLWSSNVQFCSPYGFLSVWLCLYYVGLHCSHSKVVRLSCGSWCLMCKALIILTSTWSETSQIYILTHTGTVDYLKNMKLYLS